jgi:hypothetical protein
MAYDSRDRISPADSEANFFVIARPATRLRSFSVPDAATNCIWPRPNAVRPYFRSAWTRQNVLKLSFLGRGSRKDVKNEGGSLDIHEKTGDTKYHSENLGFFSTKIRHIDEDSKTFYGLNGRVSNV